MDILKDFWHEIMNFVSDNSIISIIGVVVVVGLIAYVLLNENLE